MNASQFILGAGENVRLIGALQSGLGRSSEFARDKAATAMVRLNGLCSQFGAGMDLNYDEVSRAAHDAAFEFMTYGDICVSLGVMPKSQSRRLIVVGQALQDRALEHEGLHLAGALSPGEVFYDDLMNSQLLQQVHVKVLLKPDIEDRALVVDHVAPEASDVALEPAAA